MTKRKVTWSEYQTERNAIWDRLCADTTLTHEQRGKRIDEELSKLEVVR